MGCTDPSGYFSWRGVFKAVVGSLTFGAIYLLPPVRSAIDRYVANHEWAQVALQVGTAWAGGPLGAALGSAYTTAASGGSLTDMVKSAGIAWATATAFDAVGNATGHNPAFNTVEYYENVAGHALVGCASSSASGGSCGDGAKSAAAGAALAPAIPREWRKDGRGLAASMVVGGTTSVIGGGKFANGARTAAFGYLFNSSRDYIEGSAGGAGLAAAGGTIGILGLGEAIESVWDWFKGGQDDAKNVTSSAGQATSPGGMPDGDDDNYKRPNDRLQRGDHIDLDQFSKRIKVEGKTRYEDPNSRYQISKEVSGDRGHGGSAWKLLNREGEKIATITAEGKIVRTH